jgi:hypothetical protein
VVKDRSDPTTQLGHKGAGCHRQETAHQGVFEKILPAAIFEDTNQNCNHSHVSLCLDFGAEQEADQPANR